MKIYIWNIIPKTFNLVLTALFSARHGEKNVIVHMKLISNMALYMQRMTYIIVGQVKAHINMPKQPHRSFH